MDADGGVQTEAAAGLPGEHVSDGEVVEEAAPLEEAEHATLQRALEAVDVVVGEVRRLVEGDGATVVLGEEAVEDNDVEVEVRIEGGAEAVQEGDGAELRVAWGARAGASERGAAGAQEDAENIAGEAWVVGQEGPDPFGQGEHPLADGQRRQDVVGQVSGDLYHAAGVAGGADAAALGRRSEVSGRFWSCSFGQVQYDADRRVDWDVVRFLALQRDYLEPGVETQTHDVYRPRRTYLASEHQPVERIHAGVVNASHPGSLPVVGGVPGGVGVVADEDHRQLPTVRLGRSAPFARVAVVAGNNRRVIQLEAGEIPSEGSLSLVAGRQGPQAH